MTLLRRVRSLFRRKAVQVAAVNVKATPGRPISDEIQALLDFHRARFGNTRMEGEGETPPATPPAPPAQQPPATPPTDRGYPENTPLAEMTTEQQLAYHRYHSRKWQGIAEGRSDYDSLREKAAELDRIKAEQMTPSEKALADARAEAEVAALTRVAPTLVNAAITAEVGGRIPAEQLAPLLQVLNHSAFLKDAATPDTDKVKAYVAGLVGATPPGGNGNTPQPRWPDMGQGNRQQATQTSAERGLAEAQRRFGKATTTP